MQFWGAKGSKYAILGCQGFQICNFDNYQICNFAVPRVPNMQFQVCQHMHFEVTGNQICNFDGQWFSHVLFLGCPGFFLHCIFSVYGMVLVFDIFFRGPIRVRFEHTCLPNKRYMPMHSNFVSLEDSKPKLASQLVSYS